MMAVMPRLYGHAQWNTLTQQQQTRPAGLAGIATCYCMPQKQQPPALTLTPSIVPPYCVTAGIHSSTSAPACQAQPDLMGVSRSDKVPLPQAASSTPLPSLPVAWMSAPSSAAHQHSTSVRGYTVLKPWAWTAYSAMQHG
jgi:hypothetical protein